MPSAAERLPIRTVVALTGVSALTLRAWERRYGLLDPLRTPKGHRLYTHEHVELIRRMVALTGRGIPISRAHEALQASTPKTRTPRAADPWKQRLQRMAAAVARFDEAELDTIYDEALSLHAIEHVTHRLLLPLLVRLGERWEELPGGVAEEHFFAMYMRSKLGARLLHRMRHAEGPRLLAACGPGEQHEIGLLLFCLEATAAGMRPVVLGADTPLAQLAAAQRRAACDGIVVSWSMDPAPGILERELPRLVKSTGVPVFVGGGAAVRHRAAIGAAGALAVGADCRDGAQLIRARLQPPASRRP
jgi:DNA-binding transcriptional MerR regulator